MRKRRREADLISQPGESIALSPELSLSHMLHAHSPPSSSSSCKGCGSGSGSGSNCNHANNIIQRLVTYVDRPLGGLCSSCPCLESSSNSVGVGVGGHSPAAGLEWRGVLVPLLLTECRAISWYGPAPGSADNGCIVYMQSLLRRLDDCAHSISTPPCTDPCYTNTRGLDGCLVCAAVMECMRRETGELEAVLYDMPDCVGGMPRAFRIPCQEVSLEEDGIEIVIPCSSGNNSVND